MCDIGKNIKDLRTEKGMTQDELAEKLFVTRQTVSNYEVGKSRPDVDMLVKIGEVLDADIQELIYGPTPKPDKKRMYIRLGVGLGITILLAAVYSWLKPIVLELKNMRYLTGPNTALQTIVLPLLWLCFGWTAAQGVATVLGKPYEPPKWAGYFKWVLLGLLLVYFVPVGCFGGVVLWDNMQSIGHTSWSSVGEMPDWVSFMFRFFFGAGHTFQLSQNMGLFCLPGIGVWLCGFPKSK